MAFNLIAPPVFDIPDTSKRSQPPPVTTQIQTLAEALIKSALAGFPIAGDEELKARESICRECIDWEASAFNGMGRCLKCGCAGLKLKLATSECPVGKWTAVPKSG